jgi:hypothetical protein
VEGTIEITTTITETTITETTTMLKQGKRAVIEKTETLAAITIIITTTIEILKRGFNFLKRQYFRQ